MDEGVSRHDYPVGGFVIEILVGFWFLFDSPDIRSTWNCVNDNRI